MAEISFSGRRVLVTGGSGFIGSAVVRTLVSRGCAVLNVDAMTYAATPEATAEVAAAAHYSFLKADIADTAAMHKAFAYFRPDAVLHLAAESHVDRSIDAPSVCLHTNVAGTVSLLEAGLAYWRALDGKGQERFRFVHVSTDEVYGSAGESEIFRLDSPYRPNSPYSASKAASDHFVRAWHRTYGFPAIITHSSNNYGPFQFPEKLIPTVIIAALEGSPIPVYGAGRNVRDWLFVQDHVEALLCVLEKGALGAVYNIGANTELPNIEIVRVLCGLLDQRLPQSRHLPHDHLITFVTDRPGHDLRYALDSAEIRQLGWRPEADFTGGLSATVDWYLEHQPWWDKLRREGRCGGRIGLCERI
jgi:dTDP-glucose 4,6-dehydratase